MLVNHCIENSNTTTGIKENIKTTCSFNLVTVYFYRIILNLIHKYEN